MQKKLTYLIPFAILFALVALLFYSLFYTDLRTIHSPLVGKPLPHFELQTIYPSKEKFTERSLYGSNHFGKRLVLLNVWATWCYACEMEHAMLLKIRNDYHIPIYGIIYKDDPAKAQEWLAQKGNPFVLVGNDLTGDVALELGVYGTPETFVINEVGKIVYRHVGVLDQQVWDEVLSPMFRKQG